MGKKQTDERAGQLALALHGVADATGMSWVGVDAERLRADEAVVLRCDHATAWWIGDLVREQWRRRKGGADELGAFAAEYAQRHGLPEKSTTMRALVAEFFPQPARCDRPVSWSHHAVIYAAKSGDGLAACIDWLRTCAREKWSVGQLKRELWATAEVMRSGREPSLPITELDEVVQHESWASALIGEVASYDAARAAKLLASMRCLEALIEELRKKAKESLSVQPAQR